MERLSILLKMTFMEIDRIANSFSWYFYDARGAAVGAWAPPGGASTPGGSEGEPRQVRQPQNRNNKILIK